MSRESGQTSQEFVSSREGAKLLGVDTGRFFYYVQSHQIEKESGDKRRNARYRVADILKVKEKLARRREKKGNHGYIDWIATTGEVLESLKLDYEVYQDAELENIRYYTARVERNPHVALAVYDSAKKNSILAYISLIPLPEQVILEILRDEREEVDIRTEEVETYERKGGYTLLAESVVVRENHQELLYALLKHLLAFWCEQYPDRYITKIYAQAHSSHGDILIQKLFFSPCEDLAPDAHVLNLSRPGASRFIRRYQQCLENKRLSLGLENVS